MKLSSSSSKPENRRFAWRAFILVGISLLLAIAVLSYLLVRPSPEKIVKSYIVSTTFDYDPVAALELVTDYCLVSMHGDFFQEAKTMSGSELADLSNDLGTNLSREMLSSMTIREFVLLIMSSPSAAETLQGIYGDYALTNCWIQNDTAFVEAYISLTDYGVVRSEFQLVQLAGKWQIWGITRQ